MPRGSRPGERRGGRQKGTPNKITAMRREVMDQTAKAIEGTLPHSFSGNAHALLVRVYKDETLPLDTRLDAAKAAITYETPKLQAVEHSAGEAGRPAPVTRIELVVVDTGVPRKEPN